MTRFALPPPEADAALAPSWIEAGVVVALDDSRFLLDDGRMARQALSCLVLPEIGDKVLAASCAAGETYLLHVLSRPDLALAELSVPGADELRIRQSRIALLASEAIALQSLHDVDVSAATGVLRLNADNMFTTVNESLVENMRQYVGKAEQYLLDVAELLRLHSQQAMLLADQDVKIDAERISVG